MNGSTMCRMKQQYRWQSTRGLEAALL